jgi:UDP-hydrolysing UDP-N-acetyl-D-glucosamine 2-epimerase
MGEGPATVHWTGCPAMDIVRETDLALPPDLFQRYKGVGPDLDPTKPYLVVLQHPVTTEYGSGFAQIRETIQAVAAIRMQTVWLWPNVDAGSDDVSKGLRMFREIEKPDYIHFYRNFSPEDYVRVIANCACLAGNSSSAVREGSFLGVPAVNIGTRQGGRECGDNVLDAAYEAAEIEQAIRRQLGHGRYAPTPIFGEGRAGERIAEILATASFNIQKRLTY